MEITIVFNYKGKEIMNEKEFNRLPIKDAHFDEKAQCLFYTLQCGSKECYHISMIDFFSIHK